MRPTGVLSGRTSTDPSSRGFVSGGACTTICPSSIAVTVPAGVISSLSESVRSSGSGGGSSFTSFFENTPTPASSSLSLAFRMVLSFCAAVLGLSSDASDESSDVSELSSESSSESVSVSLAAGGAAAPSAATVSIADGPAAGSTTRAASGVGAGVAPAATAGLSFASTPPGTVVSGTSGACGTSPSRSDELASLLALESPPSSSLLLPCWLEELLSGSPAASCAITRMLSAAACAATSRSLISGKSPPASTPVSAISSTLLRRLLLS
mmetsp:Transcript_16177/g.42034  ORF Transcript_16177/g.42034 Transcript_16177/m.42034 type:complete len:268 (-) Transcript_16177:2-805(-)